MIKKKSRPYLYLFLKSFFMLLSLAGVIYAIYFLNTQGLEKTAVGSLLNPEVNQPTLQKKQETWHLCKKDVFAVSYYEEGGVNSWKLLKAKKGWRLLHKKKTFEISDKDFENCQEKICSLHVFPTKSQELTDFEDSLTYSYLDSSQTKLRLNHKKAMLMYDGQIYQADKLVHFLKNLPNSQCR